jgi:hypothetical protein
MWLVLVVRDAMLIVCFFTGPQTRSIRRWSSSTYVLFPPLPATRRSTLLNFACSSRFTAFVIEPAVKRTDITWDDEYTVIVGDWYHEENAELVKNEFLTWVRTVGFLSFVCME